MPHDTSSLRASHYPITVQSVHQVHPSQFSLCRLPLLWRTDSSLTHAVTCYMRPSHRLNTTVHTTSITQNRAKICQIRWQHPKVISGGALLFYYRQDQSGSSKLSKSSEVISLSSDILLRYLPRVSVDPEDIF
jgi:hypothetical protein